MSATTTSDRYRLIGTLVGGFHKPPAPTAVDEFLDTTSSAPSLVKNGRYNLPLADGTYVNRQRVTNFVKLIEDTSALTNWGKRMVLKGVVLRRDLLAAAAAVSPDEERDRLNEIAEQAVEAAGASEKSTIGTSLHTWTEMADRGEDLANIPEPWDRDIAAYAETLRLNGVHVQAMEQVVVHDGYEVAGRFDRILTIDGFELPIVGDVKSGSITYNKLSIAAQMHTYASAQWIYNPDTQTLDPMPQVDQKRALIIHLPQGEGRCELHLVDLELGRQVAELCAQVRAARKFKDITWPWQADVIERASWLVSRVENLRDNHPDALNRLAASWPTGVPTFKAGGHSLEQLSLIADALVQTEAAFGVAFGAPDPADQQPDPLVRDAIIARLAALPPDLLKTVSDEALSAGIPNVKSSRFTRRHASLLGPLLVPVEQKLASRLGYVDALLRPLTDRDANFDQAMSTACGADDGWTEQAVEKLEAISAAVEIGHLIFTADGYGNVELATVDGEGCLVTFFGTKREALAEIKLLADAFGLPKPRSVAEAAGSPTLLALAGRAHQQTRTSAP